MSAIAIISTNRDKYSETFIHNHVKLLPQTIHFLCDGYLPTTYSKDKGMTFFSIREANRNWFSKFKNQSENDENELSTSIKSYLLKNKIKLILCEYGPSGVKMMRIAKKLNIPLIVHFHGYDAYRNDILNSYGKQYKELFSIAEQIIGVSKHMYTQLVDLGCSESKLAYLPYGIDTTIFKYSKKEKKEFTFIACGRFVEKKAPLITIKAFEKVIRKNNKAKLLMIGDGELLQESIDLVKKLGIQLAVDFKGSLTQSDIADLYSDSFAFLQHSITTDNNDGEGTPLSIMEAMAVGLPIISTKHGGIVDIINNDTLGILVNEKDCDDMAEKMLYLIYNPKMALEIGKNASKHIHKNYNLKIYTNKLSDLIDKHIK